MRVRIKGIEHERKMDAPFVGALITASDCVGGCVGCFNQHLRDLPSHEVEVLEIVSQVRSNSFNQGIILGGLEWTEQPADLRLMVDVALDAGLQVMVYTRLTEEEFKESFGDLRTKPIWVKFGEYDEELLTSTNIQQGTQLATSNQHIKYLGEEA